MSPEFDHSVRRVGTNVSGPKYVSPHERGPKNRVDKDARRRRQDDTEQPADGEPEYLDEQLQAEAQLQGGPDETDDHTIDCLA